MILRSEKFYALLVFTVMSSAVLAQSNESIDTASQDAGSSAEASDQSKTEENGGSSGIVSEAINTSIDTTTQAVTRPWQYIGIEVGPATLHSDETGEVDKQGTFFALKTRLLFDFQAFTVEGAAGLFQASLSGDIAAGKQKASVTTTMLEAGAKWVVIPELEVGGFALWALGSESDFGPVAKANKNNLFIGVQAAFDPDWFQTARGRFLISYYFDKTIVTRNFTAFTLGYEMGLPWLDESGNWMWE